MFKKITTIILTVLTAVLVLGTVVSASDMSLFTTYLHSCSSTLSISGTTATCSSKASGYYGEATSVKIEQSLEMKKSSGKWEEVDSWSETDEGYVGSATNYKYNLSKGTYRLKSTFTVYCGSDYEVVEKYSYEKTVS